jgi:hypothetical protein
MYKHLAVILSILCLLASPALAADSQINGLTALGARPAADDELVIYDTGAGVTKKVDYQYLPLLRDAASYGGIESAVSSIGATEMTLAVLTDQTVSDDLTIPTTLSLFVAQGATISVAATKTLTVNGEIIAGAYEIFTGAGTTTINSNCVIYGEWTGGSGYSAQLPTNYITGLQMEIDTDTEHDIELQTGSARDFADSVDIVLSAVITKQIDAAWAIGDNAGGFPSGVNGGTPAIDTLYHFFVIYNPTTGAEDAGWDSSTSAANLLSDATGYTKYRWVGWVLTDENSNIIQFVMTGDGRDVVYRMQNPHAVLVKDDGADAGYTAVDLSSLVPTAQVHNVEMAGFGNGAARELGFSYDGTNTTAYMAVSNGAGSTDENALGYRNVMPTPLNGDNIYYKTTGSCDLFIAAAHFTR